MRIAKALDLDPSTVSRYLKRARDESIVQIEIRRPPRATENLEREVADRLGLGRVVVVSVGEDALASVAVAGAEHLSGLLRSRSRLGVSWGNTLGAVVRYLRPGSVDRLTIAQMAGGLDDSGPGIQGHDLVRSLGSLFPGSRLRYLHAPAIVDTPAIRDAILSDRGVREALRVAAASEVALVGVGTVDADATLVRGGHVTTADLRKLVQRGRRGQREYPLLRCRGAAGGRDRGPHHRGRVGRAAGHPDRGRGRRGRRTRQRRWRAPCGPEPSTCWSSTRSWRAPSWRDGRAHRTDTLGDIRESRRRPTTTGDHHRPGP